MDYNIRPYKVEAEGRNLKGFVTITFENQFCIKGIALKESKAEKLFLEAPAYKDYETGEYEKYFTFRDSGFTRELVANIRDTYDEMEEATIDLMCVWGDEELYYDLNVVPINNGGSFKAEVDMKIQDILIVHQIHVIESWKRNTFIGMPQRENKSSGKMEDLAHPVSGDFKKDLDCAIMSDYQSKLEQMKGKQHQQTR